MIQDYRLNVNNKGFMSCHTFGTKDVKIIMCFSNIYKFPYNGQDFYFEWYNWLGPVPVKKLSLEPRKTVLVGFYKAVYAFDNLSDEEKRSYLIYS